MDINQGNQINQEAVDRLEIGMTEDEVQNLLGTPMLQDLFHTHRWDYIYHTQPNKGPHQRRHLILSFEGSKLSKIEGDILSS